MVVYFPFQAIAVVFGFLVTAALFIMLVFALKTRQKIQNFGKSNILWKKVKVIDDLAPPQDVEAWVSDSFIWAFVKIHFRKNICYCNDIKKQNN